MIIPKQFDGMEDLETMLLTSILGVLVALKDDLISYQQAENYWFSDSTLELFQQMNLSNKAIEIIKGCVDLKSFLPFKNAYKSTIENLIIETKKLTNQYYTEYDEKQGITNVIN